MIWFFPVFDQFGFASFHIVCFSPSSLRRVCVYIRISPPIFIYVHIFVLMHKSYETSFVLPICNWLMQVRNIDKALDAFTTAVQLDPENGEAWNNIACL